MILVRAPHCALLPASDEDALRMMRIKPGEAVRCDVVRIRNGGFHRKFFALVKVGGVFLAIKGPEGEEELCDAARAIAALSGKARPAVHYTLPDGSERTLLVIEKISQTSTKYPRISAKIAKSPL